MNLIRSLVLLVLTIACAPDIQAQGTTSVKPLVLYDPLFWKHELKLDKEQAMRIQHINVQFYDNLRGVDMKKESRQSLQSVASGILAQRSQAIWNTFNHRQRKKWMKIAQYYDENRRGLLHSSS
jgi:hypothetical protein